ncbi:MAG: hypothetical protein J6N19_13610 [Clostridium sp.]|nr:hypothetical protein [Clostridium sp.]
MDEYTRLPMQQGGLDQPVDRGMPIQQEQSDQTPLRAMRNMQHVQPVDSEQCRKWNELLSRYKSGKSRLEKRIQDAEKWWQQRNEFAEDPNTDYGDLKKGFRSRSAWLFNVLASKHADYHEAYPTLNFLARAEDDKAEAKMLSKIVPAVLKQNHFEEIYDMAGWQKLKTGTGVYKVVWDQNKLHGLGDISILRRSLLNLFWEPGITDIQDSKCFFDVELVDIEQLQDDYPDLDVRQLRNGGIEPTKIPTEDNVPTDDKVTLIDVYYKRRGKLHYCKYVGETVLYATENDNEVFKTDRDPMTGTISAVHTRAADGLYDHGLYPYVFDVMYPLEESPAGFGYIDVAANAMTRIDLMNQSFMANVMANAKPRYFKRTDGGINEEEFLDTNKSIVHVNGQIDEQELRPIEGKPLTGDQLSVLSSTIQEMRETTGNTEAGNGIKQAGVTAASAYAALQEASGKTSRDSTLTSYRAAAKIGYMVCELIRQHYDLPRQFRITGDMGQDMYVAFDNQGMQPQWQGMIGGVNMGYRVPEYDIDVVPEKNTSYTKMAQNELALQLYSAAFFNPGNADQSLACLSIMDFDSKEQVEQKVAQNGTLFTQLRQWQQLALQLAARYEPGMVQGLSQAITGDTGAAIPTDGSVEPVEVNTGEPQEATIVQNARERAATSAQPGGSTK